VRAHSVKRVPSPLLLDTAKALSSDLRLRILEALSEKANELRRADESLRRRQPTSPSMFSADSPICAPVPMAVTIERIQEQRAHIKERL